MRLISRESQGLSMVGYENIPIFVQQMPLLHPSYVYQESLTGNAFTITFHSRINFNCVRLEQCLARMMGKSIDL